MGCDAMRRTVSGGPSKAGVAFAFKRTTPKMRTFRQTEGLDDVRGDGSLAALWDAGEGCEQGPLRFQGVSGSPGGSV